VHKPQRDGLNGERRGRRGDERERQVHARQHEPEHRDAKLIGAALRSTGIEDVTVVHDLDRESRVAALKAFARKADAADWAIIYYAGHGIEIGGTNSDSR
jgi:uncharacterized caspase-like protein